VLSHFARRGLRKTILSGGTEAILDQVEDGLGCSRPSTA